MGRDPYRSRAIPVAGRGGRRGVTTILVYPQCRYGIGVGHVRPGLSGVVPRYYLVVMRHPWL